MRYTLNSPNSRFLPTTQPHRSTLADRQSWTNSPTRRTHSPKVQNPNQANQRQKTSKICPNNLPRQTSGQFALQAATMWVQDRDFPSRTTSRTNHSMLSTNTRRKWVTSRSKLSSESSTSTFWAHHSLWESSGFFYRCSMFWCRLTSLVNVSASYRRAWSLLKTSHFWL